MERVFFQICLILVAAASTGAQGPDDGCAQGKDQASLSSCPVTAFRADGITMIDALMKLARAERIALGIEYANPHDLAQPVTVNLGPTTVGQAFEALLPRNKGYAVCIQDGVVHLVNRALSSRRHTLLDQVIPEFSVAPDHGNPLTVVMASNQLRIELERLLGPKAPSRGSGPVGMVGSLSGGLMKNQIAPLKLRNKTVRQILDRLVSEHHNAAWVVVVPPSQLERLPPHGLSFNVMSFNVNDLWEILEYDVSPLRWSDSLLGLLRSNWGKSVGSE